VENQSLVFVLVLVLLLVVLSVWRPELDETDTAPRTRRP